MLRTTAILLACFHFLILSPSHAGFLSPHLFAVQQTPPKQRRREIPPRPICSDGFYRDSLLKRFNANMSADSPIFGDLLVSEKRVYAVIVLKLTSEETRRDDLWVYPAATWTFEHRGRVHHAKSFGGDPHGHTLILYISSEHIVFNARNEQDPVVVTVRGRRKNGTTVGFENVPLCPPPSKTRSSTRGMSSRAHRQSDVSVKELARRSPKTDLRPTFLSVLRGKKMTSMINEVDLRSSSEHRFLVACTSTLAGPTINYLPEWCAYNALQGIEHQYLYVNDIADENAKRGGTSGSISPVTSKLQPFVEAGLVTIIDWTPPAEHVGTFLYQQAQQNSCLLRSRGRATWVALHDTDEFFYPVEAHHNLARYLEKYTDASSVPNYKTMGGVEFRTWFYGSNRDAIIQDHEHVASGLSGLAIAKFTSRDRAAVKIGREKVVARPENVIYFSVHAITQGNPTLKADPLTDAFLAHFKSPNQEKRYKVDASLQTFVRPVEDVLKALYGGR